ncbi:MAG: glycosyltransferase involved in cell wall biosynthesis [Patiriisocius sp.]|jgi:glycosyltransferase involved in cell wall biosynthesis
MDTPKVSVITINFNEAAGLKKTIASVKSQTYSNIEYIIIDGGSTDGSKQILDSENDFISTWVSEPDAGIFNAMNKGISMATGTYLQFLNSDDVYTSNTILEEFVNHPGFKGDIIYGDYSFIHGEKIYPDELYPSYFMKTSLPHQSTLFKKSVFDIMGFYDENYKISSDRAFFLKCYLSDKVSFKHIPCFLTLFDTSGISNNPKFLPLKQKEDDDIFRKYYGDQYDVFKNEIAAEEKLKQKKKNSFFGILKRINRRIKNL